jgi:hypothetical protein
VVVSVTLGLVMLEGEASESSSNFYHNWYIFECCIYMHILTYGYLAVGQAVCGNRQIAAL